jgi:hypothetical protein
MKLRLLILSLAFLDIAPLLAQSVNAPTEVTGARFNGTGFGAASNAGFAVGLSRDGGTSFENSARITDSVSIVGIIRPEP